MKKIFAGIVLPTLAAVAVIGSGFSIWFFGENQDKVSTTASIEVQNLLRIGELGTDSAAVLHLDQTNGVRTKVLEDAALRSNATYTGTIAVSSADKKTNANGLYLTGDNTDGKTAFDGYIKYTTPYKTPDNQYHDFIDGACKLQIVTTFKFEGGLKSFVGMKETAGGTWTSDGAGTYTFEWTTVAKQDKSYTAYLPMGKDSETGTGADVTFAFEYLKYDNQYAGVTGIDAKRTTTTTTGDYAVGGVMATAEPHTDAEYSDMLAKINDGTGSKLTIETVATIVANA